MAEIAVVSVAAQPVANSLFEAIKKRLKFVVFYGACIEDLDRVLSDLRGKRTVVQHEVDEATRNAKNIEDEVKKWLHQVENISKEAGAVLEKDQNSKKGCIRGVIPNPSIRYRIAKQADGKKKAIDELIRKSGFRRIAYRTTPPGIVTGTYSAGSQCIIPKSRASVLEDISKALLDDNIRIVGIWGASGVGKSTLLKEVEKQVHEKRFNYDFDEVGFAVVSRFPDLEKIQDDLAYRLGLEMDKEKGVVQKEHRLSERLSQKRKVLIILDDIWEKVDLQRLGIPFDDNHPEIKLLLTSRTKEVLMSEMNSERNFHLDRLEECEAVGLFKKILGDRAREEAALTDQLAKECAGLPVLIVPLAAALKSHPSLNWVETLRELRQFNNLKMEKFIQKSLEFNYHLIEGEEAKSLFLLCGQIGSGIISSDDLLLYGMGLGLLKGVHTVKEARKRVERLVNNLKESCLLENHRQGFVKIHDRIGDTALSIASKTHPSLVIRNSGVLTTCFEDDLKGCKSIALYLDDKMNELPEGLICPMLEMLLIRGNERRSNLEISDAFFKDLRELKVLDLSDCIVSSLSSCIQFPSNLLTLCLGDVKIDDLAMIGKLKKLRSLTCRLSTISRIPKEIGDLSNLRLLNLSGCYHLEVIEPNVLGRLIHLEELTLPLGFVYWDAEGITNASLTELTNMSYLSSLTIRVPDAASFPNNKAFQSLDRYRIHIGNPTFHGEHREARTLGLELDSCNSNLIFNELLQIFIRKTQELCLLDWIGTENFFAKLSKEGFPELKHIRVGCCPSIQYIIHSNQQDPFPVLESLSLHGLIKLRKVCEGDRPLKSFGKLKVIKIDACGELRNLFSSSLVKDLPNLENIDVRDCATIQEIITYTDSDNVDDRGGIVSDYLEVLELKQLRKLKLASLPNISSFCSKASREIVEDDGNSQFEFLDGRLVSLPCLESLIFCELPNLRKVSCSQHPVNLQSLKSLKLLKCNSLSYALDSNLLQHLRNLESLAIKDCESMETVFHMEELNIHEATLNQPLQINLKLTNLPRLKKTWNRNPQEISSVIVLIKKLEVSKCDELENIFSASMVKSLGNIGHISIASCKEMKEICLEEENGDQEIEFSSLTFLRIDKMENLTTFSHRNHHYRFPRLMQLIVSDCPKMRTFVSVKHGEEEATTSEGAAGDEAFFNQKVVLPELETLVLCSLKSMISIWDDKLYEDSFGKLASIVIEGCGRILSIFHSNLVERLRNLTKVRLLDLPKLRNVVMTSHMLEDALTFPSLRDIFVGKCHSLIYLLPNATAGSLSKLESMHISSCEGLQEVVSFDGEGDNMALLTEAMRFYSLSSLRLENLHSLVYFCSGHHELHFPSLKNLLIVGCMNMKAFLLRPSNSNGREERVEETGSTSYIEVDTSPLFDEKVVFPNLEELRIEGLGVKEIWPQKEPKSFLMQLKKLEAKDCHQLSLLVPSFMLHNLRSLESLSVESCNSMEVIIELENHGHGRLKSLEHLHKLTVSSCESMLHIVAMRGDDYKTVIFPQLSSLMLAALPRLGSFCYKNHEIELPSLVKFEIKDCQTVEVLIADSDQDCKPLLLVDKVEFPRMESMVITKMQKLTELWHIIKEGTHAECSSKTFCKLKKLEVEECNSLLTVFPSKMTRAFHYLEELSVRLCMLLESVFEYTGLRSGTESNNFNNVVPTSFALRKLDLLELPRMKHVWNVEDPRWVYLSFQKLNCVNIGDCHGLRYLFPASVARCLLQFYELHIGNCERMEEIVWNEESAHHRFISTPSPESTNLSLGMHSLEWPSLEILCFAGCPNAKMFASLRQKVNIPRLKEMGVDARTLVNPQFLDEIDVTRTLLTLILFSIKNHAWVESIAPFLLQKIPNLRTLKITGSPFKRGVFRRIKNEGAMVSCKSGIRDIAETLQFDRCPQLTNLSPYLAPFHNLKELEVSQCHGLVYLVTTSVARVLVQLTQLRIHSCANLKEIVIYDWDENGNRAKDDDADVISFPRLKELYLMDLPKLRRFSSTSCNFDFPSLRSVGMWVPKMDVFCEGDLATPYKHCITTKLRANYNRENVMWLEL